MIHRLSRSELSPIDLNGELLYSLKSPQWLRAEGKNKSKYCHWFEADVYLSNGGTFAAAVRYRFSCALHREMEHDDVLTAKSWTELATMLEDYNAVYLVKGFPDCEKWIDHQQLLMERVRYDWSRLAGHVLASLRNSFEKAEVIE